MDNVDPPVMSEEKRQILLRIKNTLDKKGIRQKDFADELSVAENTVSRWFNEASYPTKNTLIKISNVLKINHTWLLTGQTAVEAGMKGLAHEGHPFARLMLSGQDPLDFIAIPKAKQKLSAGNGNFVIDESATYLYQFRKDWIHNVCQPNDAVLFDVDGPSMEPTVMDNDIVLIDRGSTEFVNDKVFAIGIDNDVLIKRLQRHHSGMVSVISDNEDKKRFGTYEKLPEELRILGRVIWRGGAV